MGAELDLSAWMIPAGAHAEWLRLAALLEEIAAPCQSGDVDAWWPDKKDEQRPAAQGAVTDCLSCPARVACLDYALAADERFGIWGGMLPAERGATRLPKVA